MEVGKSHSYLGATPIIITDQVQAVVEVKCLFTGRKDKIQPGQNFKFRREENHKIVLDVGHQYYDQVKGQMYISGNAKCFFVVYTFVDLFIQEISLDEDYCKSALIPKLEFLWETLQTIHCLSHVMWLYNFIQNCMDDSKYLYSHD